MVVRWLAEGLRTLLTNYMIRKWDRALPLGDMLLDRWKRAKLLGFGEGSCCYDNTYIYGFSNLKVGRQCWIGPNVILDASGGKLIIGDGTSISCGVMVFTHSSHLNCITKGKERFVKKPVKIGSHTYVGSGVIILPGVEIGDYCVVGAGAVVTKSFPDNSLIMGVPARVK